MDAKLLHGSAHEFVQGFAISADGWFFETDEDATRHDKALEEAVKQRDLGIVTELINTAHTRGSNAVLVAADKLKELKDERDRLKADFAEALRFLKTAATFLMLDPDAVDTALVRDYGMFSDDTRSFANAIVDYVAAHK